jgi:hypothetical protein
MVRFRFCGEVSFMSISIVPRPRGPADVVLAHSILANSWEGVCRCRCRFASLPLTPPGCLTSCGTFKILLLRPGTLEFSQEVMLTPRSSSFRGGQFHLLPDSDEVRSPCWKARFRHRVFRRLHSLFHPCRRSSHQGWDSL